MGFGLRCLTQLLPGAAPIANKGVMGAIEEIMDDGVRALIRMEGEGKGKEGAAVAVKELLKARRDASSGGAGDDVGGSGGGQQVDAFAQGAQLVCRTLLKAAERV